MRLYPKDRDLSEPADRVELVVRGSDLNLPNEEVQVRLDAFLQRALTWRSRTSIQQLIHDGFVLVDAAAPDRPGEGRAPQVETRPGRRLLHGSRVVVMIPEPLRVQRSTASAVDLVVLHDDGEVLAVDKPPGVPVHPSGRHLSDTLVQRVHRHFGHEEVDRRARYKLCHRLDRETSGVVLLAHDPEVHAALMGAFERREVEKHYLAIVHGDPDDEEGRIDFPLGPAPGSEVRIKMAARADGAPSRTDWRVLERHGHCALLLCKPLTGRQHQIRVHLAAIGHPVVGDKLYGSDEQLFLRHAQGELGRDDLRALGLERQALHAHRLALELPRGLGSLRVESPLPEDLAHYLGRS